MRKIILVQGKKGIGKSTFIINKHSKIESNYDSVETINEDYRDQVIYVLEDKESKNITILNSGSDMKSIIQSFCEVLKRYPKVSTIYSAIRPYKTNPRLHKWMMDVINITDDDHLETIDLN